MTETMVVQLLIFYGGLSVFVVGGCAYVYLAVRKYDREHKGRKDRNAHA